MAAPLAALAGDGGRHARYGRVQAHATALLQAGFDLLVREDELGAGALLAALELGAAARVHVFSRFGRQYVEAHPNLARDAHWFVAEGATLHYQPDKHPLALRSWNQEAGEATARLFDALYQAGRQGLVLYTILPDPLPFWRRKLQETTAAGIDVVVADRWPPHCPPARAGLRRPGQWPPFLTRSFELDPAAATRWRKLTRPPFAGCWQLAPTPDLRPA